MAEILIADDDLGVLKLMAAIMARAGHTVVTASSGSEALKRLGIMPKDGSVELPDLIVLDIMMPKMDGYSVGRSIRDDQRTRRIPILAVSALREMSRIFTATVEVQGFLNKPFSPEQLTALVADILDRRKPAG